MSLKERAEAEWEEKKRFCLQKHKEEDEKRADSLRKLIKNLLEVDVEVDSVPIKIDGIEFTTNDVHHAILTMHVKCDECDAYKRETVSCLSDVGALLEQIEKHECPPKDVEQEKTPEDRLIEAINELIAQERGHG